MRKLVWAIVCFVLLSCVATAQDCKSDAKDEAAVVQALKTLYAGAMVDDMAMMHTVIAPDFYAYDGGIAYTTIDDLMIVVKAEQASGVKYVWNVTDPKVTLHCQDAWIRYVNRGTVQRPGDSQPRQVLWLESAILRKIGGAWKIVFFQSTPARTPAPVK